MQHRALYLIAAILLASNSLSAQSRPDPKEIPLPPIPSQMKPMPGVDQLPSHPEMPSVMHLNKGHRIRIPAQWQTRRDEMRKVLEYYAVGQAPPPPGNVKGKVVSEQTLNNGSVKYRLVRLTFGPKQSLSLNIGIFTPTAGNNVPTIIGPFGTPPGAEELPRLPQGANQGKGEDSLLVTGPMKLPLTNSHEGMLLRTAKEIAATNPAILHGYAFVTFNNNDCGEDTTLRLPDGSWAYRTTRFYTAYSQYDWGLLQAWAWGVSRIVDYLQTDPLVDKTKLIVTGISRTGKSALVAGAFDERIAMVAPVASSGGGTPAYRFSGEGRGGKEGLDEEIKKYPNWFSPRLHDFWGQQDKLPFDQNWFIALCAPRPFLSLEGLHDPNINVNGVYQAIRGAEPAYHFFHADDRLGVNFADRPHGMIQDDWDAIFAMADTFLLGKKVDRAFDKYPEDQLKFDAIRTK